MSEPAKKQNGVPCLWRHVPVERAADAMLEEHGAEALRQVRLGKAAAKRQRSRKTYGYWETVEKILLERAAAEAARASESAPPT